MRRKILFLAIAAIIILTPGSVLASGEPTPTHVQGQTTTKGDEGAVWLFALLGAGAIAFGASGAAVARRHSR